MFFASGIFIYKLHKILIRYGNMLSVFGGLNEKSLNSRGTFFYVIKLKSFIRSYILNRR